MVTNVLHLRQTLFELRAREHLRFEPGGIPFEVLVPELSQYLADLLLRAHDFLLDSRELLLKLHDRWERAERLGRCRA